MSRTKPKTNLDLSDDLQEKYVKLHDRLSRFSSLLVAYSGGVDSSLLTFVANDLLGDRMLAVTAASETYPTEELREAEQIAEAYDFNHRVIPTSELDIDGYAENNPDRCFLCRDGLFTTLHGIAEEEGIDAIAYGENASDGAGLDHRPGAAAAEKHNIHAPLDEAGLEKDDVRTLSRELDLPNWDKPELACLSSRFPYGTEITEDALRQVEQAEQVLRKHGFRQLRVRHHGEVARIEVSPDDISRFADDDLRRDIDEKLQELGYTYVALDLKGYQTGRLNESVVS